MKVKYTCPLCGGILSRETLPSIKKEYPLVCKKCDENFYKFESIEIKEVAMVEIDGQKCMTTADLGRLYAKCKRFEALQRTDLDGECWWCVWDKETGNWCSLLPLAGCHSTQRAAVVSIVHYCINNGIIKQEEVNV